MTVSGGGSTDIELIVDNQDTNTQKTGTWSPSSGKNPWDGQSVYNNGGSTFRWLPTIPESGRYQVYAWWTYHANRSSAVPYRIGHDGGISTVTVNQHDPALGGKWVSLGEYDFSAGAGYIEVSSENGQASADAVRARANAQQARADAQAQRAGAERARATARRPAAPVTGRRCAMERRAHRGSIRSDRHGESRSKDERG